MIQTPPVLFWEPGAWVLLQKMQIGLTQQRDITAPLAGELSQRKLWLRGEPNSLLNYSRTHPSEPPWGGPPPRMGEAQSAFHRILLMSVPLPRVKVTVSPSWVRW